MNKFEEQYFKDILNINKQTEGNVAENKNEESKVEPEDEIDQEEIKKLKKEMKKTDKIIDEPNFQLLKTKEEELILYNPSKINFDRGEELPKLISEYKSNDLYPNKFYLNIEKTRKLAQFGTSEYDEIKNLKEEYNHVQEINFTERKEENVNGTIQYVYQNYPFSLDTGWFCFCKKRRKSKISKLGITIQVYFKFLKTFMLGFLIISVINIPVLISFYTSHSDNVDEESSLSYTDILYKTTMGNIGSTIYNCIQINTTEIEENAASGIENELDLSCETLEINNLISFGITNSQDNENKNKMNCYHGMISQEIAKNEETCDFYNAIHENFTNLCEGKKDCNLKYSLNFTGCNTTKFHYNLYLSYSCIYRNIRIPFVGTEVSRVKFSYFVASINIGTFLILLILIYIFSSFKSKEDDAYKEKNILIRDFTLHLKGIKITRKKLNNEIGSLIKHFLNILKTENKMDILKYNSVKLNLDDDSDNISETGASKKNKNIKLVDENYIIMQDYSGYENEIDLDPQKFFVYDIIYPIGRSEKLDSVKILNKLISEYSEIKTNLKITRDERIKIGKEIGKEPDPYENSSLSINEEIINTYPNKEKADDYVAQYTKLMRKEHEYMIKANELDKKINKQKEKILGISGKLKYIEELYITFRNHKIASFFKKKYSVNIFKRAFLLCWNKKSIEHLYYKEKWLDLNFADDQPSDIKWNNMVYNKGKKFLRSLISIIIAIILVFFTLIILLFAKKYETNIGNSLNTNIDCNHIDTDDINLVKEEYLNDQIKSSEKILTNCFCEKKNSVINIFKSELKTYEFPGIPGKHPCENYVTNYIKYNIVEIVLIVAIPIINTVVSTILNLLTSFAKNKTLSDDISSNITKIFIIQFINSCILILLINYDSTNSKVLKFLGIEGKFSDIVPKWFQSIGVTMLFSTILSIATAHPSILVFYLLKKFRRLLDSGSSEGKTTKIKIKKKYYDLYSGPLFKIDERLGSILNTLCVVLLFGNSIPLLYMAFTAYLFVMYLIDKLFTIYYYKIPPIYSIHITRNFSIIACIFIVLHIILTIWINGGLLLLVDVSDEDNISLFKKFLKRAVLKPNKIYLIGVASSIVIVIALSIIFKSKSEEKLVYDYEEDNYIIKKVFDIGLSIPINSLIEYYKIKKMEYFAYINKKYKSRNEEDEDEESGALSLKSEESLSEGSMNVGQVNEEMINEDFYKNYLLFSLEYAKNFLRYKIKKIRNKKDLNEEELNINFDDYIYNEKNTELFSFGNNVINKDFGYNLVYDEEFQSFFIYEFANQLK